MTKKRAEFVKCYIGNHDGTRRGLVIAHNQKEAAKIAGGSVYWFRQFWTVCAFPEQVIEMSVLYTQPMDTRNKDEWVKGRCPMERL